MNKQSIQDFILKNPNNLSIAAAVQEAWFDVRQKIVSRFCDRLDSRLGKRFRGWKFQRWERFFVDAWPCYYFWKSPWDRQYYICLECGNYGDTVSFGVMRDKDYIAKRQLSQELLDVVRELYPSASSNSWWEAGVPMRSPAADWRKPEVLWRIHKDEKFLEEVAQQLTEVANVCEPIVDRLARTK